MAGLRETRTTLRGKPYAMATQIAVTVFAALVMMAGLLTACQNGMATSFWAGYAAQADDIALAGFWTCHSNGGEIALLKFSEDGHLMRWDTGTTGAESYGAGHWHQDGNEVFLQTAGYSCQPPEMAEAIDGYAYCRSLPRTGNALHIRHRAGGAMMVEDGVCYRAAPTAADAMEQVLQSAAAITAPLSAEGAEQARHSQPQRLQALISALSENREQTSPARQPRYDDMIRTSHITLRKLQKLLRL